MRFFTSPKDEKETKMIDEICPICNGSGEGLHDGTICRSCRGRGIVIVEDLVEKSRQEDYYEEKRREAGREW
jgi:DnaJ-class molecular chaperone